MQNDDNDNGHRYRRTMDREYVTRHEWRMHLEEGQRFSDNLGKHLDKQDNEIDRLQTTISRAIGGATVIIVVAQTAITYFMTR